MVNFGRALAGGIAGAARAAGTVYDDRIKEAIEARKQAVLEKREKTLAKTQHDYRMEEGQAGYDYQDKVRGEQNTRADTLLEKAITREDELREKNRVQQQYNKFSERTADRVNAETKFGYDEELQKQRIQGQKEVAEIGATNRGGNSKSLGVEKEAQKQAQASIQAVLLPFDPFFDPTSNSYELNIEGKTQKEIDSILSYVSDQGFHVEAQQPDNKTLSLALGAFDYNKYIQNKNNPTKVEKIESKTTLTPDEKLQQLRDRLNKNKKTSSVQLARPGNLPPNERSFLNTDRSSASQQSVITNPNMSGIATPRINQGIDWTSRLAPAQDINTSLRKTLTPVGNKLTDFVRRHQELK